MKISISILYRLGLIFLAVSFIAPKIRISGSFNLTLLDFFPLYFLIFLVISKKHFNLTEKQINILVYFLFIVILMFISTIHGFFLFQDFEGFLKSIAQFYRRLIIFLFVPIFIFSSPHKENEDFPVFFSKKLILFTIVSGFIGILVNFNGFIKQIYFNYFSNSKQVFLFGLYRNMGLIGEASYFADIVVISLVLLFSFKREFSTIKFIFIFINLMIILFTTVSKSSFIALLISLFFVFSLYFSKKSTQAFKFTISTKLLVSLFIFINSSFIIYLYIKPFIKEFLFLASSSLQARTNFMWEYFLDLFMKYNNALVMGFGFKGLKSYFGVAGAHNQYLGFLIDFGAVFCIYILLFLLFILPFYAYKHTRYKYTITFIVLCFSVQSFVHEPLYHFQTLGTYITILLLFIQQSKTKRFCKVENSTRS